MIPSRQQYQTSSSSSSSPPGMANRQPLQLQTSNVHSYSNKSTPSTAASSPTSPFYSSTTTSASTTATTTRHHSRSTTLTPREGLPPTLRMSQYTGDYLADLEALLSGKLAAGSRRRTVDGVFYGHGER